MSFLDPKFNLGVTYKLLEDSKRSIVTMALTYVPLGRWGRFQVKRVVSREHFENLEELIIEELADMLEDTFSDGGPTLAQRQEDEQRRLDEQRLLASDLRIGRYL